MPTPIAQPIPTDLWDIKIANTRLLDGDAPVEIGIRNGRIAAIAPTLTGPAARHIDANGGLTTPSFVDPHFHLDKVLSRDLVGALSFEEAFSRAREAKCHFTIGDVTARACRALELATAQGLGHMRAQVDVDSVTRLVSMEGVLAARERFADLIDIQAVAFPQEGIAKDPESPALLREALKLGADMLGGLPEIEATVEDQRLHIRTLFDIAEEAAVPIDLHCDYTDSAELRTLEMVADMTIERGMQGRVQVGHCNALAVYPDDYAKRVIEKLLAAEIQVSVLPIANLQMLGGPGRTPQNRGSSRILELLDAGVNVAAGADNMLDIWYRFNRMDPVDTALMTCLSGGMRTDEEVREAFEMVTTRGARLLGVDAEGVCPGATADLVVHSATTLVDLFRNLPGRRLHIKRGRVVGGVEGTTWSAR